MQTATDAATDRPSEPSQDRVVLDTNAVLDLWAFRDERAGAVRTALQAGRLDWPACPSMRDELEAVLRRGVAARWAPDLEEQVGWVLALWDAHARRVAPPGTGPGLTDHRALRCRDPDDQVFLDVALRERAGWLLTADRDLLSLRRAAARWGLKVARVHEWCAGP